MIILQIKWNLAQEFELLSWLWIQLLFLKIFIILSFCQIWSHNLEFSRSIVIWQKDICDYGFDVFLKKIFATQFFWQIWPQNDAKIVSKDCYTCCMPKLFFPKWSEFVFWNSGTRIANMRIQSMYYLQTDGQTGRQWFSKEFSEGYRTLKSVINNLHLYLKCHYSTDALHTFC